VYCKVCGTTWKAIHANPNLPMYSECPVCTSTAILKAALPALEYAASDPDTSNRYVSIYEEACEHVGVKPKEVW
jgi:hypothetical protein